ncbi:MAG: hypothetical protein ABFR36_09815 [Acidobacteriota bacterium]
MKHLKTIIGFIAVIVFGLSLFSQNQDYGRLGKNRTQNVQKRSFSTDKHHLIGGKVAEVTLDNEGKYGSPGIHLIVNDGKDDFIIHMGPEYFFKSKGIGFKKGDSVKLNAFEGKFNGKTVFFASSVDVAGNVTIIRNKSGDPEWRRSAGNGNGRGRGSRSNRGYRNR